MGTYGRQLVEAGKELVEKLHELLGAAGGGQLGKAYNICKEDAAKKGRGRGRGVGGKAPDSDSTTHSCPLKTLARLGHQSLASARPLPGARPGDHHHHHTSLLALAADLSRIRGPGSSLRAGTGWVGEPTSQEPLCWVTFTQ